MSSLFTSSLADPGAVCFSVRVVGPDRFVVGGGQWFSSASRLAEFLRVTLAAPSVRSVTIDRQRHEVDVRHEPGARRKVVATYRARPADLPELDVDLEDAEAAPHRRTSFFRYGRLISDWIRQDEKPGLLRLRHPGLRCRPAAWDRVSKALDDLLGIVAFRVDGLGGSLTIRFDPALIHAQQIVHGLHRAVQDKSRDAVRPILHRLDLPVATASLALSGGATFVAPALLPVGTALMLATAVPSYHRAIQVLVQERRLGVDVLDSIIFTTCLFTGEIFAGAMTSFFLSVGRTLLRKTQAQSARLLVDALGRQPSIVRLERADGSTAEVRIEDVKAGDVVVVHTGEAVPVDGVVQSGEGMLDQQALTGEAAPVERAAEDSVLAATLLVAGQIRVRVERAGKDTTAGKIADILRETVSHKLKLQSRGESLADSIVVPALGVSALAGAMIGPSAALAVINSDLGTGIRMAAPLAVVTSLSACIRSGILVKQGRALETLPQIDTVVFDKTGTLTRSVPEVGEVVSCGAHAPTEMLRLAAAAEQNFSHPIARAIVDRYQATDGAPLPVLDASQYALGFGLTVIIEGRRVRLGSRRFMDREGLVFPESFDHAMAPRRDAGHTLIYMGLDDEPAGLIDLRPSQRPEAADAVESLRAGGIKELIILSGDHDRPTRQLANQLGMERYFAEVLPEDKAAVIAGLQREGRRVCFVGDGINDALALRQADVSVSLSGAAGIATDTAQVVFLEGNLRRMGEMFSIARELHTNVGQSWNLIRGANGICIAGVFLAGFNIWHSVFFNNASALGALGNSLRPLQRRAGAAGVMNLLR
ncbi:heavy metal translocating P-type ATPase [Methylobacterium organophilum]|uniref:P-type Zn(2+) transporter n=1 Tax=Methylobacterium organophilum TaxID=410 RepID=A0ABQ4TCC2_METOR|nr:heavy metal translocating P-type ATPase [Methylobacterium organophilum]GJE28134.1 Potassium-transporting ATPase ATP-binding subunit [Methylobacterium organophilum]